MNLGQFFGGFPILPEDPFGMTNRFIPSIQQQGEGTTIAMPRDLQRAIQDAAMQAEEAAQEAARQAQEAAIRAQRRRMTFVEPRPSAAQASFVPIQPIRFSFGINWCDEAARLLEEAKRLGRDLVAAGMDPQDDAEFVNKMQDLAFATYKCSQQRSILPTPSPVPGTLPEGIQAELARRREYLRRFQAARIEPPTREPLPISEVDWCAREVYYDTVVKERSEVLARRIDSGRITEQEAANDPVLVDDLGRLEQARRRCAEQVKGRVRSF